MKLAEKLAIRLESKKLIEQDTPEIEDETESKLDKILDRIESKGTQEQLRLYKGLFQLTVQLAKTLPQGERNLKILWRNFFKDGFKKD